jgi:hypothetical protein
MGLLDRVVVARMKVEGGGSFRNWCTDVVFMPRCSLRERARCSQH